MIGQKRTGYMDMTDFQHELGQAKKSTIYANLEDVKNLECVRLECGIVEVEVRVIRVVKKEQLPRMKR